MGDVVSPKHETGEQSNCIEVKILLEYDEKDAIKSSESEFFYLKCNKNILVCIFLKNNSAC